MNWAAAATVPWVSLSATNGTLAATGGSTNVLVSLNAAANSLALGIYNGVLTFTNLNTSLTQTFNLSLTVSLPLIYSFPLEHRSRLAAPGPMGLRPAHRPGRRDPRQSGPDQRRNRLKCFRRQPERRLFHDSGRALLSDRRPAEFFHLRRRHPAIRALAQHRLPALRYATIDVSSDGTNWTNVFQNPTGLPITDSSWNLMQLRHLAGRRPSAGGICALGIPDHVGRFSLFRLEHGRHPVPGPEPDIGFAAGLGDRGRGSARRAGPRVRRAGSRLRTWWSNWPRVTPPGSRCPPPPPSLPARPTRRSI